MRFASPGTGELLQKEHSFGLYLIDQVSIYIYKIRLFVNILCDLLRNIYFINEVREKYTF